MGELHFERRRGLRRRESASKKSPPLEKEEESMRKSVIAKSLLEDLESLDFASCLVNPEIEKEVGRRKSEFFFLVKVSFFSG